VRMLKGNSKNEIHFRRKHILMKKKLNSMGRVAIALVLALSLCMVMAVPVSAAVTEPAVTPTPNLIDTVAEYTIEFTTGGTGGLTMNVDTIIVTFTETTTTVPVSYATGDITVNGDPVEDTAVSVVDQVVTITTPVSISASSPVEVIFTTAAGIENPTTAGDYTLSVATSGDGDDVAQDSATYTITDLPTVTSVQPDRGNAGETMWVEVTGTYFTATDDVCSTSFDFGTGVSVVAGTYHFIDAQSVDCQITISSDATAGAREVTATSTAGEGAATADAFTVGDADTPQVDVWDTYTPVADLDADAWDLDTLAMDGDKVYDTIQEAVSACTATEVVIVHAATYEETITIDQPGITLESMNGAASTIIDANGLDPAGVGASMHCAAVMITAEAVTFGGTDKGFTVKDAGVDVDAGGVGEASTLWADDNSDGIADATGVYIWPNGGTNAVTDTEWLRVSVIGNTIYGSQARGIRADVADGTFTETVVSVYIAGNTVYDNLFHGFSGDALGDSGTTEFTTMIEANKFRNNGPSGGTWDDGTDPDADWIDAGIEIQNGVGTDEVSILSNDIHHNFSAGIYLRQIDAGTLVIEENTIHDNGGYGIQSDSTIPGDITCQYNDIYGNTDWGINNSVATALAAEYNYWGEIGGPSAHADATAQTALGNGDAISDYVTYDLWLTESQVTVIEDGIRSYGSDALALEPGWNTLSAPCGLKSTGNDFGEIEAMGTYLGDNFVGGYWYDASTGDWTLIGPTTTIEPGKGFYVNMSAASTFPVLLFDGLLSLPAYDMYAGWNLIGSMFGIDTDGDYGVATLAVGGGGNDEKTTTQALPSIAASASVIISPSVPGQTASWAAILGGDIMYVGEGYWVFMTADGTLAGWEVLPYSFTPGAIPE